jgi:hypothetical protein
MKPPQPRKMLPVHESSPQAAMERLRSRTVRRKREPSPSCSAASRAGFSAPGSTWSPRPPWKRSPTRTSRSP